MDLEEQEHNAIFIYQIPLKQKPKRRLPVYKPKKKYLVIMKMMNVLMENQNVNKKWLIQNNVLLSNNEQLSIE